MGGPFSCSRTDPLSVYQLIPDEMLSKSDDNQERLDVWFRNVFDIVEEDMSQNPAAFKKLIKMAQPLAHGNAFLERGFNNT